MRPPGTSEPSRPAPQSMLPQPNLSEPSLLRLVTSEFHEMFGVITSTRASRAAVTHWMPPPYELPFMPTRGSPALSSWASGCLASQSISAETSRAS